ncbi:MAG TPA: enoyl-CoA hydratase/isomerase family protein [Hypericibacter adhaerens]|uniref:Enoyl-CoA hydratase n=1 Tax=Hypericibacter adhaerens TaxID=2602016 RepID=A0A5J6MXY7_9PROT|nr:enoyl-CoA hydratase/isomerase family protein [Hypericibacter adhaerens]QEX22054.1 enoyl-CoA hydratase [Hypericibacter adhaerens]HWA46288.1 enoyl-CoA hydratase/isomerase family protein [Hypericibacter adhaerens]
MSDTVMLEIHDRVACLTINRERSRNALNDEALGRLKASLENLAPPAVAAIVIRGAGLKAFSAGSDIKELASQSLKDRIAHTDLGHALGDAIEQHPCPVIAAIEGYCLGGGLEIASACDYRIAGAGAVLGLPEVALNALPSWGGTIRLPRIVGVARARELVLFGRRLTAEEAMSWSLVNRVVPQGEAFAAAVALAKETFGNTDPGIVSIAKGLLTHGTGASTRTARHLELLADMSVLASEAMDQGVKAFSGKGPG